MIPAKFLSTPSVGRATPGGHWSGIRLSISIHALRGEGDSSTFCWRGLLLSFLSTPSVGRATHDAPNGLLNGGDFYPRPPWGGRLLTGEDTETNADFYPRPPWGGRPINAAVEQLRKEFLSTPSVGRATLPPG